MAVRVVVSGAGSMGHEVLTAVCAEPDLEPVGVLSRRAAGEYRSLPDGSGRAPYSNDASHLFARTRPDVLVDFTNAEFTPTVVRIALEAGVRPVIGTSGLTDGFLRELDQECRARGLGAVVAPNFALGAVVMIHLSKIASRFFDHAEVIEAHHERKADAPSGTALNTARRMVEARGAPFQRPATLKETLEGARGGALDGVTLHSVRLPGVVARQQVIFGGPGQTLTIAHDSISRESFMPGVVLAVRDVMQRSEAVFGLERLIGLEE